MAGTKPRKSDNSPPQQPRTTLTDSLRAAILASDLNTKSIAETAGITHSQLSRFMATDPTRHRDLRLASAEKVAAVLGLRLVQDASH